MGHPRAAAIAISICMCVSGAGAQTQRVEIMPVEDKGMHTIDCGIGQLGKWVPSVIIFPLPPGAEPGEPAPQIDNKEFVECSAASGSIDAHLANVYPAVMQIPEDAETLELHFFMTAVNESDGLVPLPSELSVTETTVTGLSGTEYTATLNPISSLSLLPTSTAMSPVIEWDLSQFAETNGTFYLARVELPVSEVPEPASLSALLAGAWLLLARRRRS